MAMTPKEKADRAAERAERKRADAVWNAEQAKLRTRAEAVRLRSNYDPPTMIPPPQAGAAGAEHTNGWTINAYSHAVEKGWSKSCVHGSGHLSPDGAHRNGSQSGCRLYASRRDALIGLRLAVEQRMAEELARIDMRIEAEDQATAEAA